MNEPLKEGLLHASGPARDAFIQIGRSPTGAGFRLESVQFLPVERERLFEFFSDAFQLQTSRGAARYAAPPGLAELLAADQWLAPLAKLCRRSAALFC